MRLLVVEDDIELARELQQRLRKESYAVDLAFDGNEGEYLGKEEAYDAIILDLGLPQKAGLDVLKSWRAAGIRVPVLVLTARDAWFEKVDGFKAGADDYLAKPFHIEELLARLQALLRRSSKDAPLDLTLFGLSLDEDHRQVLTASGDSHVLTETEYRLLRYFMMHPGKILSKQRLLEHIYEYDTDPDSNVIEVYVKRLRNKIGDDYIQTRRGQGYIFAEPGG